MRKDRVRNRKPGRQKERRPIHRMEPQNLFAHQVHVGGPELAKAVGGGVLPVPNSAQVAGERVEPDVEHMFRAGAAGRFRNLRQRNPPLQRRAADREIAQPAAHKRDHFIAARLRADEFRVFLIVGEQALLEGRELEEIVFFRNGLGRPAALRAGIARPTFRGVEFIGDAILPRVIAFIDIAVFPDRFENLPHRCRMFLVGSPNEGVKFNPQAPPLFPKQRRDLVGELLRREAGGLGRALHLLPMLIGPAEQEGVVALHLLIPANRVGHNGAVGVPQVRRRVYVVERSCQIEFLHDVLCCWSLTPYSPNAVSPS